MNKPEEAYKKNLGSHNGQEGETTEGQSYQQVQAFNPKINERSNGIERGYEDLIQWQARVNAKQQLLQKFKNEEETRQQEQDSRQVFTNSESNKMIAEQRRAKRVEDTLLQKGEEAKIKRLQKEQEIYGSMGRPQVNTNYSSEYTQKDVYTRLYGKAIELQQQKELLQRGDKAQQNKQLSQRYSSPQQAEKLMSPKSSSSDWKKQVVQSQKVFAKSKVDVVDEQAKLMAAMKANFQSAKAHLLQQKGIVDEARQKQEEQEQEQQRILELEQLRILQQQRQNGSMYGNDNLQKQIEFGVSAGKPQDHEDATLVNSLIGMNEIEMQIRAKEKALQQEKQENDQVQEQNDSATSKSPDNRIIFLAPDAKEINKNILKLQQSLFPNVMSPRTVILEQEKRSFKSNNEVDIKNESSPQSSSPQQLMEKKASEQFKQFFKPMAWNAEAARLILESKTNSILGETAQEASYSPGQIDSPSQAQVTHQKQLNYLVQNYPILTSNNTKDSPQKQEQQQQPQQLEKSSSQSQLLSKQINGNSSVSPQNLSHHSSLYAKTMLKQMEEGTQGILDPKCVYVDFRQQSQDKTNLQRSPVAPETITQKEILEMVRKQNDWLQQKELKIKYQQEQKLDNELVGCTFKPDLRLTSSACFSAKKIQNASGKLQNNSLLQTPQSKQALSDSKKQIQLGQVSASKINVPSYSAARQQRYDSKQHRKTDNFEEIVEQNNSDKTNTENNQELCRDDINPSVVNQEHQQEEEGARFNYEINNQKDGENERQFQENSQEIQIPQ